jgi:signal transduction histidine kinase
MMSTLRDVLVRAEPSKIRNWKASVMALAIAVALTMLLAGVALAIANERAHVAETIDQGRVEGGFLAIISAPALRSDDYASAQTYLDALQTDPDIESAAIYDTSGRAIAAYQKTGSLAPSNVAPPLGNRSEDGSLTTVVPVVIDGTRLGTVLLLMATEPLAIRLRRYIGVGLLVTMAALVVIVLGLSQAALTDVNARLEERAVALASANRELRVQMDERERVEAALRQSQKMEAIGRLTGGVAHDFNNLLTVLQGNLELIDVIIQAPSGIDVARVRRHLDSARQGLLGGAQLTRRLLTFSRQEPLATRTLDLNAVIADFAPLVRQAIRAQVDLRLYLSEGRRWWCRLDPAQFEAAILNLAINARDAMRSGGTLTITTLPAPSPEGEHSPEHSNSGVLLSISDTGEGMPREVTERIFEPFFTTKPAGKGTGLGLAQVWAFVTQSGGHIQVESEPGRGTTFRLYLPLASDGQREHDTESTTCSVSGGTETILLVQHDGDVREVTSAYLESMGYRTIGVRNGVEAWNVLAGSDRVELLFMDSAILGRDAGDLAREALKLRPTLKVLMMSDFVPRVGADALSGTGGQFPVIAKPYHLAELSRRIREVLEATIRTS